MPSQDDPVKPIPFDVAKPAPAATLQSDIDRVPGQRATPRWVLPALAGLIMVALAVIVWLPASLEQTTPAGGPVDSATREAADAKPAQTQAPAPVADDASPWQDAQAARQRRTAQETAAALLDLQYSLEAQGVELWGTDTFTHAQSLAAAGDALYRERDYKAADEHYRQSLAALETLEQSVPDVLEGLVQQARNAIENGRTTAAQSALAVAAMLSPDSSDIATLQARAARLPTLLPLLEHAAAAEAAGDLSSAQQSLAQATALDPEHLRARRELARVALAVRERDFTAAMSEGYAALDEGRFDSARKSFRRAASLQEGSTEAASALQDVAAAETADRLGSLEQQGRAQERREQWQQAVATYARARKLDSSVLFASDGLQRSRPRAQLDRQLQQLLDEPQRLSDITVANSAQELLAQAARVRPKGPRLQEQVAQLATLLQQYNSPVTVSLRSDSQTEVTVYTVARLGRFAQRELTLRPGTYTAVGTRDGYRDVRHQFTLVHDSAPAPVTIICTEPI
ncbi:MAG: hypothetical protein HRT77_12410 [Halioglobus sp.]|nr:hypothetical protein [Halioglobus sp.]